jgi:hypothetical protein
MYTLATHAAYNHFLVSVSIAVGRCITKGGRVSKRSGANNCRLDHSWGSISRGGSISHGGGISRGGSKSHGSLDYSGGGVGQRGGSSHNWCLEGDLVCVSVRGGNGGGDCCLDYCWSCGISYGGVGSICSVGGGGGGICCVGGGVGGICRVGGGGSICCDGGSGSVCSDGGGAEVASRCGGEEQRQKNLWKKQI